MSGESVTVLLKDGLGGRRQTRLPLPFGSLAALLGAIRHAFQPELDSEDFFLTSGLARLVDSDAAVRKLRAGDQLQVNPGTPGSTLPPSALPSGRGRLSAASRNSMGSAAAPPSARKGASSGSGFKPPAKERISFVPHPKTLTMAGDYEYFSARGHHPFAFALAELVDNSLRATKGQSSQRNSSAEVADTGEGAAGGGAAAAAAGSSRSRDIVISLLVNEQGTAGLIRVQDNGRGMSPKELAEWAVMNLSMEDRGLLPSGTQRVLEQSGGGRFLSGDLSFFGVGSKNAAFFMGSSVKLATRQAGSDSVHELCIAGAELERRYKCGENVYEEDMVHREPGDESTLSKQESVFAATRSWLADEPAAPSFTRVTISDLRADVLSLIHDSDSGAMVCRDLAHLYHYYLHGPAGNVGPGAAEDAGGSGGASASGRSTGGKNGANAGAAGVLPGGEVRPNITVEYLTGSRLVWRRQLADVDDDLESRYVRGAKAKLEFELDVPGKGTVEGVLWYFPFVDGAETIPRELGAAAYSGGGPAGAGGAGALTQHLRELPTQMTLHGAAALAATQLARLGRAVAGGTQAAIELPDQMKEALVDMLKEGEHDTAAQGSGNAPMFETFWQGRLIPGSGLDSLPFIEGLRAKMRGSSSGKDYLPDDVFGRIRGALFFGPAWRVTRNKLTFRDALPELLANATPSDRGLDKRLREWLHNCHTRLDRILHFQGPADVDLKAVIRKELGEGMTGFMRMSDGTRTISAGDVVRLSTKPAALGRVKYFSVPQAGAAEGVYATGFVTFSGLPAFLHGPRHSATLSIRRVEEVVSPATVEEFTARERAKLPSSMRLEPIRLASGRRIDVAVGDVIPETTVTLHNSAGQKMTKTFMQGQKVALRVKQRLVYMGPNRPSVYCSGLTRTSTGNDEPEAALVQDMVAPNASARAPVEADAAADPQVAAPPASEAADGPAVKRGRKRKKKNGPAEEADQGAKEKENQPPQPAPQGPKRARRGSGGDAEAVAVGEGVQGGAAAGPSTTRAASAGPLPEGIGEEVLVVENKTPLDNSYQFSKVTGGLTRTGTYFLEYVMLPDLPPGCDPAGGPGPAVVWCRSVLYAVAGAPVRFELRGEARAVLATKAIALGEVLPPLQLVYHDAHGNVVSPAAAQPDDALDAGAPAVAVELIRPGSEAADVADEPASSRGLDEIQLEWKTVATPEALVVQDLRLRGCPSGQLGMRLFGAGGPWAGAGAQPSLQSFDRTPRCAQDMEAVQERDAVSTVDLQLRITMPDMPSQVLSLKVRPGAPAALRLLPGHPFTGGGQPADQAAGGSTATADPDPAGLPPVPVMNGEAFPEFQVLVLDAWGNATCPTPDLPASVQLEGPVLQPNPAPFDIDNRGVATVQGVRVAAPDSQHIGMRQEAHLAINCTARGNGPRAAMEMAASVVAQAEAAAAMGVPVGPGDGTFGWSRLTLPLVIQPCTLAASIQLQHNGQPCEVGPSASGDGSAALLHGVPAGTQLTGLSLVFLDEGGRPAELGFKGKLQVSWSKGTKKVTVSQEGARYDLPPLPVREQAGGEPQGAWIRFVGDGPLAGMPLETSLEISVVAGPPASWGLSLVSSGGAGAGVVSQATENLGFVACGELICLEVEAHDVHGNRCAGWSGSGPRPTPEVVPTRDQADAPLLFDRGDWLCGWETNQHSGCEVYAVRMALGGSVGPVRLVARDTQGPGGESLLQPDELPVELQPGRPTTLAFDGPQQHRCGTRGSLGDLRVRVTDDWGNLVEQLALGGRGNKEGAGLEVTLASSAIATDDSGNAAKVTVAGSNKARVSKGTACFRDVKVEGCPGTYGLRVGSASRKVALREAKLVVEVVAQNLVRHVAIAPCSLPQEPLEPGAPLELQVEVTAEDGMPLPFEAATAGLTLRLKAPCAEAAAAARGDAAAVVDGGAAGGAGGSSAAACTVVLQPQPPDEEASQGSRGLWTFVTPGPLVVAGQYSVTAEYTELRPELVRTLPKAEQTVRSVSHVLELLPGPPVRATLEQDPRAAGPILVTNGADGQGRSLLSNAAVQIRDEYGNPVALDGVYVRWVLGWPSPEDAGEGSCGDGGPGSAPRSAAAAGAMLPALQGGTDDSPCVLEALTDSRGRAFFKDVTVVEGSGKVGSTGGDETPQALHLELRLHAALLPSGGPSAGGATGWLCCWSAPVMFSDDAARAATLQRLCARRDQLVEAISREEEAKGAADRALDAAHLAVQQAQAELQQVERRAGASLPHKPETSAEARGLLKRLREQHHKSTSASQQRKDSVAARFGPSTSGVVMALNRCLAAPEGNGEVVGVIAQLATVDNPHLSALLSAAFSSTLQILVVRTYECIKRLRDMLTANRNQLPSMLAINMVQGFTGDGRQAAEVVANMRNVSQEALDLQAAAAGDGADPPLPMLLPHTRMLMSAPQDRVRAAAGAGPAADEWPHGCLGYAVNLVRPVVQGHRATIFYSQLGRTLVFETLDQAAAYRTFVVQALGCSGLGDIYTLDGGKLSGRGVVVGSGFRVVALEDAVVRFGAVQSSQAAQAKHLSQQVSDMEAYAAALEVAEGAAAAEAQAAAEAEAAEQQVEATRAEVADELQQLEAEIARLAGEQPGGGGAAGGSRQRGGRGGKRRREAAAAAAATAAAGGENESGQACVMEHQSEDGAGQAEEGGRTQRGKRTKGRR